MKELLCAKKLCFDKYTDLLWKNIRIEKIHVTIEIKSSKCLGAKQQFVRLGKLNKKEFCPVRALKKLKQTQKRKKLFSNHLPVFRKENGKNITAKFLIDCLQKTKETHENFSGKSFRSGIPSLCAKNPSFFESAELKKLGRWKSKAYENYIRDGNLDLLLYEQMTTKILNL